MVSMWNRNVLRSGSQDKTKMFFFCFLTENPTCSQCHFPEAEKSQKWLVGHRTLVLS